MTKLKKITNHFDIAKSRLMQKYVDRPKIAGVLKADVDEIQEIENVCFDLLEKRFLPLSTHDQLDRNGTIIGEPRNFRDDIEYLAAILTKIELNRAGGEPDSIITALKQLMPNSDIHLKEVFPASFNVEIDDSLYVDNIKSYIQRIAPVGVKLINFIQSFGETSFIMGEIVSYSTQIEASTEDGDADFQVDTEEGTFDIYGDIAIISDDLAATLDEVYLNNGLASLEATEDFLVFEDDSYIEFDLNNAHENYTISDFGYQLSEVL